MHPPNILLFNTDNKKAHIAVTFKDGTFWLTQKTMADLFQVKIPAISKHLKNIFDACELEESTTVSKMEIVQKEGHREVERIVDFYRLEAVLAVGYRVNSAQATQFRKWATQTLVSAYLDLAENNAQRGIAFSMAQWTKFLNGFLELSNYPILKDKGKVSMLEAKLKAGQEYDKFRVIQDNYYESDFDRVIKKLKPKL